MTAAATITSQTTFVRCRDARYRNVGGEGVVVRQSAGEVLVLNEVGARVLDLAHDGHTVGAILDTLAAEFDVGRATLEADVRAYLGELLAAGIIE